MTVRTAVAGAAVAMLLSSSLAFADNPPPCDHTAFAVNFIWCWTNQGRTYAPAFSDAYKEQNFTGAKDWYRACQKGNDAARDMITNTCIDAEDTWRALKHTISCYEPRVPNSFIGYGSKPTWKEASYNGLEECVGG
jgi:hypothetical protein